MTISENKPTSLRRQEASRANGARSHGPVTPEGKARSSQNAATHGFLSVHITLTPADQEVFDNLLSRYLQRFEPRDQAESDLVEEIVWCNFRMRQMWIQETSILGLQMENDRDVVEMEWRAPSEFDRRALAFVESIKDSNALSLLQRYSRAYANQAQRALKMLMELKKQRLPPGLAPRQSDQPEEFRNEPSPENEQCSELPTAAIVAYTRNPIRSIRVTTGLHRTPAKPLVSIAGGGGGG